MFGIVLIMNKNPTKQKKLISFTSLKEKVYAEIWKKLSFILMQYKLKYGQCLVQQKIKEFAK